jgi:glycosyltransferase involved in cell wall biosynthesis
MAESEPALTIAICTRNRRAELLRALASLAAQRARVAWDVLVVENASEDDSRAAVEAIAHDFPVPLALASEPVRGLSAARNRALAVARAPALVYLDDDATCRPGWVEAHARALAAPSVLATGGRILPVLPSGLPERWRAFLEQELGGPTGRYDFGPEPAECGPGGPALPFGGNLGIARNAALSAGGFRTDLGYGPQMIPGEETALLQRIQRGPGRILYLPDAVIDHHIDAERTSIAAYQRWYRGFGRSLARLDPPANARERWRRAAIELARAARAAMRGRSPRALRERECALGHAAELWRGVDRGRG